MEISRELQIDHSNVSRTLKRFDELGTFEDRRRSGRPRSARTAPIIRHIKEKIRRQPKRSKRKMARVEGISEGSVRNIVKEALGSYSYKLQDAQHLDENKMRIRKERLVIQLIGFWIEQNISDAKLFFVAFKMGPKSRSCFRMKNSLSSRKSLTSRTCGSLRRTLARLAQMEELLDELRIQNRSWSGQG